MRRLLSIVLLCLPAFAEPARDYYFEITTDETQISEDIGVYSYALSNAPAAFWTDVQVDGDDVAMAEADGTEIPFELVDFDSGAETGRVWFKGAASTSEATVFRLYYGDATATAPAVGSTYGRNNVWTDFEAVYHLTETGGTTAVDATGNGHDLTSNGSMDGSDNVAGPYEGMGALNFNGSQWLDAAGTIGPWPITISAWFSTTNLTGITNIAGVTKSTNSSTQAGLYMAGNVTGDPVEGVFRGDAGSYSIPVSGPSIITSGTWHSATTTRDAAVGTAYAYLNGANQASNTTTLTSVDAISYIGIAARPGTTPDLKFTGSISEVRYKAAVDSADYVATYHAMIEDSAFWTTGTVVSTSGSGPAETGWVEFGTATGTGWASPSNALTSLLTFASDNIPDGDTSAELRLTNSAGLSGVEDPVTGIRIRISATGEDSTTHTITDSSIRLVVGGTTVGSNKASPLQWFDSSIIVRTYGGASNLWGLAPTAAEIKASDFGVGLIFESEEDSDVKVYLVEVNINYGAPDNSATQGFFFD
jgi:hypothetical protein